MGSAFTIGLILVVISGDELFTGNCAYFIPLTIFEEAEISGCDMFIKYLISSTLGNILDVAIFVGIAYWYAYSRKIEF